MKYAICFKPHNVHNVTDYAQYILALCNLLIDQFFSLTTSTALNNFRVVPRNTLCMFLCIGAHGCIMVRIVS